MIEVMGKYGLSMTEAIEVVDSLGNSLYKWDSKTSNAEVGSLYYDASTNQVAYYNKEGCWQDLWDFSNDTPPAHEEKIITYHSNCRNCGAPYKGRVCEYCGTILP